MIWTLPKALILTIFVRGMSIESQIGQSGAGRMDTAPEMEGNRIVGKGKLRLCS